jgi:hypothetical protein
MDRAILLSPFELRGAAAAAGELRFGAVIAGSEFCQNQLPEGRLLRRLAERLPGADLWLATSLVTDKGLARWERLLRGQPRGLVKGAVVNDLGLLPALCRAGIRELSAGRLLLRELAPMERGWARAFLRDNGFVAGEADTPELEKAALGLGLAVSRHAQFSFTAVTTFCPFEKHFRAACGHACEGRLEKLSHRRLKTPLFLAEKAYFSPPPPAPRPRPWREVLTLNFLPERRPCTSA